VTAVVLFFVAWILLDIHAALSRIAKALEDRE
jgi:hypothetical protein